jgi:hypothetical protein
MYAKINIAALGALVAAFVAPGLASAQSYFPAYPQPDFPLAGQTWHSKAKVPSNAHGSAIQLRSVRSAAQDVAQNYKAWDVYTPRGSYAGRDPDPAIRLMLRRDGARPNE